MLVSITACTSLDSGFEEDVLIKNNSTCLTRTTSKEINMIAGDVRIVETRIVVEEGERVSHSFVIDSPHDGEYYLSVFMVPEDYSIYMIKCNGNEIAGSLKPQKSGWQTISFTNENGEKIRIPLIAGTNEIRFYSSSNEYPEIESLRMTISSNDTEVSTESYDRYLEQIESGVLHVKNPESSRWANRSLTQAVNYQYELDCPLLYSFTKTMVLTNGNTGVTFRLANFDQPVILDVFKDYIYTISYSIPAGTSPEIYQNFPRGTYTIHLRRQDQSLPCVGLFNISINNQTYYYGSCIASGYNFETISDNYTGGLVNNFTCWQSYGTDPVLFLEKATPSFYIDAINDNYVGTGDFDWSVNARIKSGYGATQNAHVYNASANIPEGTCDLYIRIPSYSTTAPVYGSSSLVDYFPSIKDDDTMLTDTINSLYNCIGWAGDLLTFVWPTYPSSPYYYPGVSELTAFDMYFTARGYTRTGANADNAGVALWALPNGDITHASIRRNNRSIYPHGYDWESKAGWYSPRFFHEKNALVGDAYGYIQHYYRPDTTLTVTTFQIETPVFSDEFRALLSRHLHKDDQTLLKRDFSTLYHSWKEYCDSPQVQVLSKPFTLKDDISYKAIVSYCSIHPNEAILFVIDKLAQGDIIAGLLLDDILPEDFDYLKSKTYHHVNENRKIIPSMLGNYYRLAEAYLNQLSVK